jgi:hypothetical protein
VYDYEQLGLIPSWILLPSMMMDWRKGGWVASSCLDMTLFVLSWWVCYTLQSITEQLINSGKGNPCT